MNCTVPSAPVDLVIKRIEGDPVSLYFDWKPPSIPNGYIVEYNVYCQKALENRSSDSYAGSGSGMLSDFSTHSKTLPGSELNATITDLIPFTSYECFVTAKTSAGEGNATAFQIQTTDEFSKIPS